MAEEGRGRPFRMGGSRGPRNPIDQAGEQIENLMSRIDVPLPSLKDKKDSGKDDLVDERTIVKNVQGSSSGAGSGEFHVYRALRRKEYARLKELNDKALETEKRKQAELRREEINKKIEEKTMRNRKKRLKRQIKKKQMRTKSHKKGPANESLPESTENQSQSYLTA